MDPDRWERVKKLFESALPLDPKARDEFVAANCRDDEWVRREVLSLLAAHRNAGDFMQPNNGDRFRSSPDAKPPPLTFAPGELIAGRFKVLRFIGHGGMGEVYEATDLWLNVRVALKTIRPKIASDPDTMARFKQEIELARRVAHPNVCRMHDLERHRPAEDSGKPEVVFLTMELLEGQTLAERLSREGKMTPPEALTLISQMAEGLAAAHKAGVLHCDFKPGNVMLASEKHVHSGSTESTKTLGSIQPASAGPLALRAVITDFGLSRALRPAVTREALEESVRAGSLEGTLPYMAPEQLEGGRPTAASDIYALGLVIYEMTTGHRPFSGATDWEAAWKRLKERAPSPRVHVPDLDRRWEQAILQCLERDPAQRYPNARQVSAALVDKGKRERLPRLILLGALALILAALVWHLRSYVWGAAPKLTTSSPEALKRYQDALKLFENRDWPGSIRMAQSAIDLDPGFAMAHLLLARDYDNTGDARNIRQELALARQYADGVTERERLLIRAFEDFEQGVYQKALEEYQAVLQLEPRDRAALEGVANTAPWVGQQDLAIEAQRKILTLKPHYARDYIVLIDLFIRANRFSEVRPVYEVAEAQGINDPQMHWPMSLADWGADDLDAARHELDLLREGGGTYEADLAGFYLGRMLQYEGRMQDADATLRAGFALDQQQQSSSWVPGRLYLLIKGDLLSGKVSQARKDAAHLAGEETWNADDLQAAGLAAIELGKLGDARQNLSALDTLRSQRNSVFTQFCYLNLRGEVDLANGQSDLAAASERQALVLLDRSEAYASLGKICMKKEDWGGAVEAYGKYLTFKGEILRDECAADWVIAHLQLARAYAKLGDKTKAESYYDRFLALWARADPSLPLLLQAQREKRALEHQARTTGP